VSKGWGDQLRETVPTEDDHSETAGDQSEKTGGSDGVFHEKPSKKSGPPPWKLTVKWGPIKLPAWGTCLDQDQEQDQDQDQDQSRHTRDAVMAHSRFNDPIEPMTLRNMRDNGGARWRSLT
jgi:hypothetical protein